jgi:hypothetical protein
VNGCASAERPALPDGTAGHIAWIWIRSPDGACQAPGNSLLNIRRYPGTAEIVSNGGLRFAFVKLEIFTIVRYTK